MAVINASRCVRVVMYLLVVYECECQFLLRINQNAKEGEITIVNNSAPQIFHCGLPLIPVAKPTRSGNNNS